MKIVVGCDHGGFALKQTVIDTVKSLGHEVIDVGTNSTESVDYPDFAQAAAKEIESGNAQLGVLICGTGIGISIAANKCKGIRCALCHEHLTAQLCRQHNNANIVAMGARIIGPETAIDIVKTFLTTDFLGDRHERRVNKIMALE
ncbi:ribose 5-phosphate isomerase B family protein [Trichomonas vaginalis G3]|uniref:Ribose 5-phosphate isomerase B family protein n=1 Tax=Trichomonas vaginalis (strain ATCC PRA-98 / G3) TaxID=412133 RepID=A2FRG0_TRIV3|nr:ribose/galactose isomerase family [Trichomonas vaginalis G3]EAX92524.1 ribose 5-phosphate isomerase B family protein [Trichomonas vaginalis G3]KAI5540791.1 ribose/galactose isomerase family [Trichomonas vaginalis G3]|eukprot:XP_001305454.1 ribose 5-phosphate isomerase B family protein [Trichomonas vaginalis G3]